MTSQTQTVPASQQIINAVGAWPELEVGPGKRGAAVAFFVGRREIGHLHGDRSFHAFFPRDVWVELRAAGRIEPHPVFPDKQGPAARAITGEDDVREVVELLRLNYERVVASGRR